MTNFNHRGNPPTLRSAFRFRSLFNPGLWIRLALFSVFWVLLTGWQPGSWVIGAIFTVIASSLSFYLAPRQQQTKSWLRSLTRLFSFLFYFFVQSLRGGWDTAKLALMPKSRLSPGFIRHHTNLATESQIFTFMQVLSLLPGTVSTEQNGRELTIHVLNLNSFNQADIDDCELMVGQLLGSRDQLPVDESDS